MTTRAALAAEATDLRGRRFRVLLGRPRVCTITAVTATHVYSMSGEGESAIPEVMPRSLLANAALIALEEAPA